MKFSYSTLITVIFSITVLSTMAQANFDLFDLRVESEIVTADAAYDLDVAEKSRENLQQKRTTYRSEIPQLREEIRQAYSSQKWAQKEIKSLEKQSERLEEQRRAAQSELNKATVIMQKTDRLLKSAQGHFDRKQKLRDAVVERKEKVVARMMERTEASQLMVERVEQAERDLKFAEVQYQKIVKLEKEQKLALKNKNANIKKRLTEAHLKTMRIKNMTRKIDIGPKS